MIACDHPSPKSRLAAASGKWTAGRRRSAARPDVGSIGELCFYPQEVAFEGQGVVLVIREVIVAACAPGLALACAQEEDSTRSATDLDEERYRETPDFDASDEIAALKAGYLGGTEDAPSEAFENTITRFDRARAQPGLNLQPESSSTLLAKGLRGEHS